MTHTIVISDLHGMSNLLDKALVKIDNSGLDVSKIVFTGAVFGGPLSVGVFDDTIPGGPIDVWEITGGA